MNIKEFCKKVTHLTFSIRAQSAGGGHATRETERKTSEEGGSKAGKAATDG